MDDKSSGVTIDSNTIGYCRGAGIYIHNASNVAVRNNLSYGNRIQFELRHDDIAPDNPIRNLTVSNNVFASNHPIQVTLRANTKDNIFTSFGTFLNNVYATPFDKNDQIYNNQYTLADWVAKTGQDGSSKLSPRHYNYYQVLSADANLLCESTFNTGMGCYSCWSNDNNCNLTWDNANKLNGGSARLGFNNPTSNNGIGLITNTFSITAGSYYRLKLSAISNAASASIDQTLLKSGGDYRRFAPAVTIRASTTRRELESFFQATESATDARFDFNMKQTDGPIWVDNLSFQKVTIATANPNDSLLFLYNPTKAIQTQSLSASYVDSYQNAYNNQVQVKPFSGILLYIVPTVITGLNGNNNQNTQQLIYPNPTSGVATIMIPGNTTLKVKDVFGNVVMEKKAIDSEPVNIDLSGQGSGIYIIETISNNETRLQKLILQK